MLSLADLLSAACGVNLTEIEQEAPGARLAGQLFVCANQDAQVPARLILFTVNGTISSFLNEATIASLV